MSFLTQDIEPLVRDQSDTDNMNGEGFDVSDIITCTKPAQPFKVYTSAEVR